MTAETSSQEMKIITVPLDIACKHLLYLVVINVSALSALNTDQQFQQQWTL